MAGQRDDEPGVLGNLPRSRPGQRSGKRGTTTPRAKKAPPAKKPATARAKPTSRSQSRPRGQSQARPRPRAAQPAAAARKSGADPVTQAVELAGKVAAVGVRTAAEIVKRIPRI